MGLRACKLTAQQAAMLWQDFYTEHGAEVMQVAYGWDSPTDRRLRKGEHVWGFWDGPSTLWARVGWGLVNLDPRDADDDEAHLVVGVFPEHQCHGYRVRILDWLSAWAAKRGAKYAKLIVFAENEANHRRHHAEAEREDSPWIWAGDNWYPDLYSTFVRDLKEAA